jgi:hypothetical protein
LLKTICWLEFTSPNPAKKGIKYWCQDETKIGLKTLERKKIIARGVKPIGKVHKFHHSHQLKIPSGHFTNFSTTLQS